MGTTATYALRYPELSDSPDGSTQIKNLANDVDAALAAAVASIGIKPAFIRKTADEARASTTTLANDGPTGGSLAISGLVSAGIYEVAAVLLYDGGTGVSETDLKWKFTVPASSSGSYGMARLTVSGDTANQASAWTDTNKAQTTGIGTAMSVTIKGLLIAGGSGTLQLQWAQGTSSGTNTHLLTNSYLMARKAG